jgi:hypothetical protein
MIENGNNLCFFGKEASPVSRGLGEKELGTCERSSLSSLENNLPI